MQAFVFVEEHEILPHSLFFIIPIKIGIDYDRKANTADPSRNNNPNPNTNPIIQTKTKVANYSQTITTKQTKKKCKSLKTQMRITPIVNHKSFNRTQMRVTPIVSQSVGRDLQVEGLVDPRLPIISAGLATVLLRALLLRLRRLWLLAQHEVPTSLRPNRIQRAQSYIQTKKQ